MIEFDVLALGAWGPGFANWPELVAGCRDGRWAEPAALAPGRIPPRERRRSPQFVKMAVEVMSQACEASGLDPAELPVVFATAMSDMRTNDYMCLTLADTPAAVSPTRFHNSVNNAATGYWSIATGSHAASNALCGFLHSAGMGLLEAAAQVEAEGCPVLLVVQDEAAPPALEHICPSQADAAFAVLLAPAGRFEGALARWRLETMRGAAADMGAALESLAGNPAAGLLAFMLTHADGGKAELDLALNDTLGARLVRVRPAGGAS